ncbi:hypothetical protein Sango_2067000 [Sesamum angolense]|uniref:Uncharacterized protein n=1 Tax=Sesamum angolense TaxID=2727404 RepID=A0AAE1WAX3_9LAMI|nr:hypothetical protein Sango_2067000 [Sesamum angolense]
MVVFEDEEEELVAQGSDESKTVCALDNNEVDAAHDYYVSMHAMTGLHDYRTMRVTGNVRDKPVHILIDTGSTHNFLDLETAKRLGCKLDSTEPFPMTVANVNKMYSSFACKNFGWKMQGVPFTVDMMILPLGGCEVVLGVQCLEGDPDPSRQLTAVRDLLTQFSDLFEERKALPPRREHDHNITLKLDTSPINVRPYRYPTLQKNEIE